MTISLPRAGAAAQTDLCEVAIRGCAEAMKTPEGRAAIEKGRAAYLRHLAEKGAPNEDKKSAAPGLVHR